MQAFTVNSSAIARCPEHRLDVGHYRPEDGLCQHLLQRPPRTTPALYAQDGQGYRAIVHAHYFHSSSDWLVTEYDPEDDMVFGWACLGGDRQMAELGYASVAELESVRVGPGDLKLFGVEYDLGWPEGLSLEDGIAHLDRRQGKHR